MIYSYTYPSNSTYLIPKLQQMLKFLAFTRHLPLTFRPAQAFSTFADPYYILGVDKNTPFPEIKKAFYKLANEFHPDKNDTQQAQKKFVIIKEAFESIKMEKGMMKPQNLYRSEEKQSMRPNPEKYTTEDAENEKNFRDYTVFSQKAAQSQEYMTFNSSFKTINDINSVKIKVQEGQMKDPTSRFNLDKYKARISSYSQSGNKPFFVIVTGLVLFTAMMNQIFSEKQVVQKENALKKLTQVHKRKTIQSDLVENKKIDLRNIENSRDFIDMKKAFVMEQLQANNGAMKIISDVVVSPQKMNRV